MESSFDKAPSYYEATSCNEPTWAEQSVISMDNMNSQFNLNGSNGNFNRCHLIDIACRSDYVEIKHIFDSQILNLKVPGGTMCWPKIQYYNSSDFNQLLLSDFVIFKDSIQGCEYITRVWGIEKMKEGTPISKLGTECMLCSKVN